MLGLLPDVSGQTVLDAGCGTGRYLELIRSRNARAIGIDRSQAMLSCATRPAALIRGDLCALPLETGSVDAVVCALALGDVADLALAIAEFARVVRPGGLLLYSVVHPDGGPAGWTRTFDTPDGQRHVASYWHSRANHERSLAAAGFRIDALCEPAIERQAVALVVKAARRVEVETRKVETSKVETRKVGANL